MLIYINILGRNIEFMKQKRMISEYSSIIKSQDYMNELKAMAARIRKVSFSTPNEATIRGKI